MSKKAAAKNKQEPPKDEVNDVQAPTEIASPNKTIDNSSDSIANDLLNNSYNDTEEKEMMKIYSNIYDSNIEQNMDKAAEIMVQKLKKTLTDDVNLARTKDQAARELKISEIKSFSNAYVKQSANDKSVQNYFADQLIEDNLLTKVSVMVKSGFEVIAKKVETDIKSKNTIIPKEQLELREANSFLGKGYNDVIKVCTNEYKQEIFDVKYKKDSLTNPNSRKISKLGNRVKAQEARKFVYEMNMQRQDIETKRDERQRDKVHDDEEKAIEDRMVKKTLKKKAKHERVEKCKERIAQRKLELKTKLDGLVKFENDYKKKKQNMTVRAHRVVGRKFRKEDKKYYTQKLLEIHEAHKPVRLHGDIDKHQEHYESLKQKVKHKFDEKAPLSKKLGFYNSEAFLNGGKSTTAFPTKDSYKNDQAIDVKQLESEIEKELEGEFDPAVKEEKLKSLKGKNLATYLYHKKRIMANKVKSKFFNPEFDTNNSDNLLYKGLPVFEKEAKEQEFKDLIKNRQEVNKSLPSLYLEKSREMGKKGLDKLKKQTMEKGELGVAESQLKLPEIHVGNRHWYPNYLKSVEIKKSSNPEGKQLWHENIATLDKGSLQRQIADVKSLDKETMYKDLKKRYEVKSIKNPKDTQVTKLDSLVQSGKFDYDNIIPNNQVSTRAPASAFFDTMKAKVAILKRLVDVEEESEKEEYGNNYKKTVAHMKYKQRKMAGNTSKLQFSPSRYSEYPDYNRSTLLDNSLKLITDSQDFGSKNREEKTPGTLFYSKTQIKSQKKTNKETTIAKV